MYKSSNILHNFGLELGVTGKSFLSSNNHRWPNILLGNYYYCDIVQPIENQILFAQFLNNYLSWLPLANHHLR